MRLSLNKKATFICKHGVIEQVTLSTIENYVISYQEFKDLIIAGKLCFSYTINEESQDKYPFIRFVQCVDTFGTFVNNVYMAFRSEL